MGLHEGPLVQVANKLRVDRRLGKLELVQRLGERELGDTHRGSGYKSA